MGVYIKGMKMPTSCHECVIEQHDENYFGAESNYRCPFIRHGYTEKVRETDVLFDCPLGETVRVTSAKIVANEDALRIPAEAIKRELVYELAKEAESVTRWKVQDVPELHSKEVRMSLDIVPEERGVQSVSVD